MCFSTVSVPNVLPDKSSSTRLAMVLCAPELELLQVASVLIGFPCATG